MVGFEDGTVKSKEHKRNLSTLADDECHIMTLEKFYKRIILALAKPSYLLLGPMLLLIECKDKEAVHELERFCGISNASLPIRLRAYLLERVDPTNSFALSTCVEDSLKSDPTCRNYSPESLLEMIALYLDAVFVEYNTWREFA
ncbi:hypothetical protein GH714_009798 [Hevea brasiliensis]|uniref:Uncharacterized protein n=1 Tax=Hevea brasiliensis TaxID=3981 RepID=A0A6A6M9J6_HEVBR|nr:hypothetical protein GH714_009798 [Hevea brasiliensis]